MSAVSVAVVQGQPWHFEVIAAILYSFVQIGSNTTLYCRNTQTSNLQKVIEPWYSTTFRPYEEFEPVSCNYSLVVFVTFPEGKLFPAAAGKIHSLPGYSEKLLRTLIRS